MGALSAGHGHLQVWLPTPTRVAFSWGCQGSRPMPETVLGSLRCRGVVPPPLRVCREGMWVRPAPMGTRTCHCPGSQSPGRSLPGSSTVRSQVCPQGGLRGHPPAAWALRSWCDPALRSCPVSALLPRPRWPCVPCPMRTLRVAPLGGSVRRVRPTDRVVRPLPRPAQLQGFCWAVCGLVPCW